jgi:hypothetical protein
MASPVSSPAVAASAAVVIPQTSYLKEKEQGVKVLTLWGVHYVLHIAKNTLRTEYKPSHKLEDALMKARSCARAYSIAFDEAAATQFLPFLFVTKFLGQWCVLNRVTENAELIGQLHKYKVDAMKAAKAAQEILKVPFEEDLDVTIPRIASIMHSDDPLFYCKGYSCNLSQKWHPVIIGPEGLEAVFGQGYYSGRKMIEAESLANQAAMTQKIASCNQIGKILYKKHAAEKAAAAIPKS